MNISNHTRQLRHWLLMGVLCVAVVACNKEDDAAPTQAPIDINDANAVAGAITINGATVVNGTPPAPSANPSAPVLSEYGIEQQLTIQGTSIALPVAPELSGAQVPIAGVYLQIKGSNTYYDIPAAGLTQLGSMNSGGNELRIVSKQNRHKQPLNGREKQDHESLIEIPIPANLQPGTFCILYCVYDEENQVSNVVEVCVEVIAFGGENSSFLTQHGWKMAYTYSNYDGISEVDSVGKTYNHSYITSIDCADGTWQEVTVNEVDRTDYVYFTATANGGASIEEKYYYRGMDYYASTCATGVIYREMDENFTANGAWSYDDVASRLTIVVDYEGYGAEASTFDVKAENGQLILSETDAYGEYGVVFVRR